MLRRRTHARPAEMVLLVAFPPLHRGTFEGRMAAERSDLSATVTWLPSLHDTGFALLATAAPGMRAALSRELRRLADPAGEYWDCEVSTPECLVLTLSANSAVGGLFVITEQVRCFLLGAAAAPDTGLPQPRRPQRRPCRRLPQPLRRSMETCTQWS